jgi:hypothetical protein
MNVGRPRWFAGNRADTRPTGIGALLASLVATTASLGAERLHEPNHGSPPELSGGSALAVEPAPVPAPARATARPRRSRIIFACHADGIVEFSDRPCDLAATSRSLEFTTGSPGATPSTKPHAAVAAILPKPVSPRGQPADQPDDDAREKKCATLEGQLDAVDSRMREGYSARDAAKLWNRWRAIKDELHSAEC